MRHQENFGEAHLAPQTGWSLTSHVRCERHLFLMAAPYRDCAGPAHRPLSPATLLVGGIRLRVVQSISDGGFHAHGPAIHFRLEGLSAQHESGRIKKARLREAVSYCYGAERMTDSASRSGET